MPLLALSAAVCSDEHRCLGVEPARAAGSECDFVDQSSAWGALGETPDGPVPRVAETLCDTGTKFLVKLISAIGELPITQRLKSAMECKNGDHVLHRRLSPTTGWQADNHLTGFGVNGDDKLIDIEGVE